MFLDCLFEFKSYKVKIIMCALRKEVWWSRGKEKSKGKQTSINAPKY